jgi:Cytochrome c7 and related cytochrome c
MTKSKKIMFGIFVLLVVMFVVFRWREFITGPRVEQPLEYSHKIHTEMLKCEECHIGVVNSASATIPNIIVCMGCHKDEPLSNSPDEKKLLNYIKNNKNIPWKRLYRNPVHVYFSHNRHVSVGKLACEKCHGDMGKTVKPPSKALVKMGMSDCIACHKKNNVDRSCIVCHK